MLKQNLQQKLGLKINPLQIQLIKLIEIPTYQLEQRIKEEIEQNPLLEESSDADYDEQPAQETDETPDNDEETEHNDAEESDEPEHNEDDEFSIDDYMSDDDKDVPDYRTAVNNTSPDDDSRDFIISQSASFRDHLMDQLGTRNLSDFQQNLAEYIIGNIDDDGYLRRDLENIVDDLAFNASITVNRRDLEEILHVIHDLDPWGIGARDLRECLMIQLRHKLNDAPQDKELGIAFNILDICFEEFTKKHYEKIMRRLNIDDGELKAAMEQILKLNPKPGGTLSSNDAFGQDAKIIPDFSLDLVDGELQLSLNTGNLPELRINKTYLNILEGYQKQSTRPRDRSEVATFIKYKLSSAKSFIDAVQQRNNTLMLTMTAIIQYQRQFFLSGDENQLRPMILRDIADVTGLDVSTISRVSNSKYVQTWFGIYALKDFFTGSMPTNDGEEVSTGELKNTLRTLVDNEDKHKPLTDDELVDLMSQKGYQIARRTIAKYRQMLDIPVARLRREI